jgi:hypothetical protein
MPGKKLQQIAILISKLICRAIGIPLRIAIAVRGVRFPVVVGVIFLGGSGVTFTIVIGVVLVSVHLVKRVSQPAGFNQQALTGLSGEGCRVVATGLGCQVFDYLRKRYIQPVEQRVVLSTLFLAQASEVQLDRSRTHFRPFPFIAFCNASSTSAAA